MRRTIFVSSTFRDLAEHRRAVWDLLLKFDVDVRGMEGFGARTKAPLETCLAEVEQSNVYLGLIGFRLGSLDEVTGKSFTQREYERAQERNLETLIYLRDEDALLRLSDVDLEESVREKLASFKRTLRAAHTVDTFSTPSDLVTKLQRDLQRHLSRTMSEPIDSTSDDFERSREIATRFLLLPKSVSGTEIRVQLRRTHLPFPASRGLCAAFNLPYGETIGVKAVVTVPAGEPLNRFKEVFAAGRRAVDLLGLGWPDNEVRDVFVRLEFSPDDISRSHARFFGEYVYIGPEPDEDEGPPFEEYRPGEGRPILLFSKFAK